MGVCVCEPHHSPAATVGISFAAFLPSLSPRLQLIPTCYFPRKKICLRWSQPFILAVNRIPAAANWYITAPARHKTLTFKVDITFIFLNILPHRALCCGPVSRVWMGVEFVKELAISPVTVCQCDGHHSHQCSRTELQVSMRNAFAGMQLSFHTWTALHLGNTLLKITTNWPGMLLLSI